MSDNLNFESFKQEALSDPKTREEYEALTPIWELRRKLIRLRTEKGVTQEELAKLMGTNKANISRLECGESAPYPTFKTISKYANALGYKVSIDFDRL